MKNGRFIVIDGPDGCGKSTQVKLLEQYLRNKGRRVLAVRDPGSTTVSEDIRKILLNPYYREMTPLTELFLYFASRAQLVEQTINPTLKKNNIVISDRFLSSTIVYQGYAGNIGAKKVSDLWRLAAGGFEPKITIILDVPPGKGLARIKRSRSGHDRMEQKALLFHKKVRQGFIRLANSDKNKYKLINGSASIDAVQNQIRKIIDHVL